MQERLQNINVVSSELLPTPEAIKQDLQLTQSAEDFVYRSRQAVRSVDRGGTVLFFAPAPEGVEVSIPLFEFWRDEVTVSTSYAAGSEDLAEAIELLRSRRVRVEEMITHRLSLAEGDLSRQQQHSQCSRC